MTWKADYVPTVGFKKNVNRATTQVMMKTGTVELPIVIAVELKLDTDAGVGRV